MIVVLATTGLVMVNAEVWPLYPLHKSFGVAAVFIIVLRIIWRWRQGFPLPMNDESSVAHRIARLMHIALLVFTVLLPLSGMLFSGASGHGFSLFGLTLVSPNPHPSDVNNVLPYNETLSVWAQSLHHFLGYGLAVLVALHVTAALKHHFVDRDRVLQRMLGR